jgi:transcriptional regulator with GAF, ATPase, and Fis domain
MSDYKAESSAWSLLNYYFHWCRFNQPMISFMGTVMEIKSLKNKEEELLREVLGKTHWDLVKTARLLKITLPQVKHKIKEFGIESTDDT